MKKQETNDKWVAIVKFTVRYKPENVNSVYARWYQYALLMPKRDEKWVKRTVVNLQQEVREIFERERNGVKIDMITHYTKYFRLTGCLTSMCEIVELWGLYSDGTAVDINGQCYHQGDILSSEERKKPIDWEQRRYEIARDILASIMADPGVITFPNETHINGIIDCADVLIAKLQERQI